MEMCGILLQYCPILCHLGTDVGRQAGSEMISSPANPRCSPYLRKLQAPASVIRSRPLPDRQPICLPAASCQQPANSELFTQCCWPPGRISSINAAYQTTSTDYAPSVLDPNSSKQSPCSALKAARPLVSAANHDAKHVWRRAKKKKKKKESTSTETLEHLLPALHPGLR